MTDAGAQLLNLRGDVGALRRLVLEQRKEAAAPTTQALGLCFNSLQLRLLAAERVLVTAGLLGAAGILAAAIEGGKLRFQP